ncbi:MAG: hemolysin family protein [Candidatus Acidiferrales bacterium]
MALINIFVVLLLVAANGFFVAAEFSLVAVRPTRIHQLKLAGDARARIVENLLKDLDRVLSGVQHGITMSSLLLGWLGEITLASLLEPLVLRLGLPWPAGVAHGIAIVVAFTVITALHVVLGELVPKSMALQRSETIALMVARPMVVFMVVFRWVIDFFDGTSTLILRALGYHGLVGHGLVHSAEEFQLLVEQAHQHGVLTPQQERMLGGALEMSLVQARQIMTPRADMVSLSAGATLEQAIELVRAHRRSRYPVYEGSPDQVIGVLHAKDLLQYLSARTRAAELGPALPAFDLRQLLRECLFVPESRRLAELLEDFRRKRRHVAIVVDEFGSVQGMVTLGDLIETIVGEVRDEYEAAPVTPRLLEGGMVLDGRTNLLDLEHQHQVELPSGPGFETLAGFILSYLGYIPAGGESFLYDGLRLTVLEMDGRRIARVKLERIAPPAADAGAASLAPAHT